MTPPRSSLPPVVQSEITRPGLCLSGRSQDQGDQQLPSGGGPHQLRSHALAPTLSLPRRKSLVSAPLTPGRSPGLLVLPPPHSRVSSSVASYGVTSLLCPEGHQAHLTRVSPMQGGWGRAQCVVYSTRFVCAPLGAGGPVRTVRAPAEARADLRAVTVLLRTSLPAVPSPLLIPRSPSFFRFNNPGCIVPLNQTICVRALRSGREGGEDRSPLPQARARRLQEARREV